MIYTIENGITVKKWAGGRACYTVADKPKEFPLHSEEYALLRRCDGMTDLPANDTLDVLEALGVIRRCEKGEARPAPQQMREYPNTLSCVIDWTITESCNYNCLHCFHAADNERRREMFSREEAFRFLRDAEACGISGIRLTGGEPTLYPWFREIVEEIRNRGMALKTLITNGSMLDEALAAFIAERHPKVTVMLSFDGIGTHDWLRQHPGSEESVKRAIRVCKKAGLRVEINMNVNRRSRPLMVDSVRLLAELGVDRIRIIKTTEAPRWQLNAADDSLTIPEYYDFSAAFAAWYMQSGLTLPITIWQCLYLNGRKKSFHILPVKASLCGNWEDAPLCSALTKKLSVQANGDIIPCAPMAGYFSLKDIHMGNVKQDSLQKLLSEGPLLEHVTRTVREKREANAKCAACRYFQKCQGGCPALSVLSGGSFLSSDDYKCVFFEGGYFEKLCEALSEWHSMIP